MLPRITTYSSHRPSFTRAPVSALNPFTMAVSKDGTIVGWRK